MTLQANALLTVEEGRVYLGTGPSDDALVEDLINRASDYCESPSVGANRPLVRQTWTDLRLRGQTRPALFLDAWPVDVTQAVTVELDGTALTVWRTEADGDPATFDVAVAATQPGRPDQLVRAGGWTGTAVYPVRLTYTGGFPQAAIPGDLKQAAYDVLEAFYRAQDKRLTDVSSVGGTSGAPSVGLQPTLIPLRARQVLDAYRVYR